jgi:LmbE family N-acetylglucosaminyl deacetylase
MSSTNLPRIASPLHETAARLGTILSVWAHPDDETYLAAGIMAAARDNGQQVVCVSATAGEHGTADPVAWPPARLGRVRRWEAAAAMAVLGVTDHRFMGYEDGSLRRDDAGGIARVEDLLDEVRPDTVLTFGADGMTFHSDHIAIHHWVTTAWHRCGHPGRLLHATVSVEFQERFRDQFEEWDMYMSDERPTGVPADDLAAHVHLTGIALDRKLAALRAMSTQTGGLLEILGAETYAAQVAEEAFVAARCDALVPERLATQ